MADGAQVISIRERLLKERRALLDLSTRNRLLNTPLRTRNNRAIEIVDEKSAAVFRSLSEGKAFTFLPGVALDEAARAGLDPDDTETAGIPDFRDGGAVDAEGYAARHADLRLQTRLTGDALQKRLFDIWYDARTLEEEQGVNILYLAIGLLRWFDKEDSEIARHAPLVLLPVALERSSAADRFKLKTRNEPPSPNITLQAKLEAEFGLALEDFHDEDALDLAAYCARVAETVSRQPRWEVLPDAMVLGFYSFAKFLMYRDLDPDIWPAEGSIDDHTLVGALLRDGFPESEPLIADDRPIDDAIPPLALNHVVDADSSQAVAIAEAGAGRSMVVKGPPGTGKSQTITNIIAAAAAQGKKVLFVAEKMAALEVVHQRLRQAGLGPLALELHSNKANKRAILEELRRTKEAALRPTGERESIIPELGQSRDGLNLFARRLHTPLQPSGLTPHRILGRLVRATQDRALAFYALPGYALTGAQLWTADEVGHRRKLVTEIAERLVAMGPPPLHPWRGVGRGAVDPVGQQEIGRTLDRIGDWLASLRAAAATAAALDVPPPQSVADLDRVAAILGAVATLPPQSDRAALAHPAWAEGVRDLDNLLQAGERHARAEAALPDGVSSAARTADLASVRTAIAIKGRRLFRFLDSAYRAQIDLLQSYLEFRLPKAPSARLAIVDRIIEAQQARAAFEVLRPLGAAFGRQWKDDSSDWGALRATLAWRQASEGVPPGTYARIAALADPAPAIDAARRMAEILPALHEKLAGLVRFLELDLRRAFGVETLDALSLDALSERLTLWRAELESVSRFIAFAERGREAAREGLAALIDAVHDGALDAGTLGPAFERAYAETLRAVLFDAWPALSAFDGDSLDREVASFRQLDRARIDLAKAQIAVRHAEERPRGSAGVGPLGVLNAELAKRSRHLPMRLLLERAGPAIQQLKPVFMMSPLSVAQYLKPGGLGFDLLVMDEASQIEPVDAIGAIARARQIVVVGDERQLPPTSFFRKLTGDESGADEDDDGVPIQAKDAESILDLCLAKGAPHRMLSWHYRSKHQSLIAVSNREFYESRLHIVPSPYDAIAGMGLKFHLLPGAAYDRGGTRTNPAEAKIVAEAAMRHARETPEQSLGVATFSVAQRQAILRELELLRKADPALEDFFGKASAEPFFVKNLENIQGDERDVIFISVGYGKTEQGYLAHAFGPLSAEGGERRLNVLISRAKMRCEVFCNFTGADIDPERSRARGVVALKMFLTFAETGKFGLGEATGLDHDSEFEREVADRLRARGHDVKAQIGASGFRVDLAVCDPEKPGRFVLGIECDGAQYHSSRSARDRDRLRQQVLESHGWIIHRIWSADWYLRPNEELKKVEAAIEAARAEWRERDAHGLRSTTAASLSFAAPAAGEADLFAAIADPNPAREPEDRPLYREARFAVDTRIELHDTPLRTLVAHVVAVVEVEGPIHEDEIVARLRTLWGLQRAGTRIRKAIRGAIDAAIGRGLIRGDGFYSLPDQPVVIRNRAQVASATLRKPEMLPPAEIDAALLGIVAENFGAARAELAPAAARSFGFAATSAQLRAVLESRIDNLVASGRLRVKDGLLVGEPGC